MEDKIITLAIHTKEKAFKLKEVLESRNIPVYLEELSQNDHVGDTAKGYAVKIKESQISKALTIIEENKLFSYNDMQTLKMDDGRKRILVAVDFSTYSMKACQTAFSIAKELDAKVKILHVYNNIYFPTQIPFADALKNDGDISILDKSRKQMLDLCVEIDKNIEAGKFPSVNYSYSLREGIVEEEIESFIEEYKPMLLVLGKRGTNDNRTNILGSVTADIIEMTDIPVLAIPENSSFEGAKDVRHIAFFTNIHRRDIYSFDYLVNHLLPYKGLKITLVHIITDARNGKWSESDLLKLQESFTQKYSDMNISYKLINETDFVQGIKDFIETEKVDIVAVNTQRRSLWGRMFLPSNSRKILASLNVVLLTLRGEKGLF
ncbi:universal stress protein [Dysgonomonas capnocytophagoides]|uniref:Universal stress protein n=1 Tax=Dysgonomonas capnocytophagoides TaxID=45254 RepID=A0A4Y8L363_9BACT|nr:universal stress protein [Dysgonomonas capnocytophagoides]TFD94678.1 universal stress protein [Dysgonomonas capnocytophagoides]